MASPKLSSSDKRDLEKFTKYLVYKCIQIIVQSRLGERTKTQSRPFSTGSDWFNLAVKDIPEVYAECKKVITTGTLSEGCHVCVEISLKTTEGDSMILETWWLTVKDQTDPLAKVSYTVYNRMGVMLKSLYCTTRATPAYGLSRKQGPDSYVVCYRIYTTEPEMLCLGDAYETKQVGGVPSPTGTIVLSVAYRTKMLLSPHSSVRGCLPEDCKLDHFKLETSPKRAIDIPKPCFTGNHENRSGQCSEEGYVYGESEYCATSFSTSPPSDHMFYHMTNGNRPSSSPSQRNIVRKASSETLMKQCDNGPQKVVSESALRRSSDNQDVHMVNGIHNPVKDPVHSTTSDDVDLMSNIRQIGGFVSDGESDADETDGRKTNQNTDSLEIPFVKMVNALSTLDSNANAAASVSPSSKPAAVIHPTDLTRDPLSRIKARHSDGFTQDGLMDNGVPDGVVIRQKKLLTSELSERLRRASGGSSKSSASSHTSGAEEYVMIDEKTTLSEMEDNPELGQFYRECKLPPNLAMFSMSPPSGECGVGGGVGIEEQFTMQDMYNSITDQLNQFEVQAQDFDDFVNSLSVGETS